MDLRDMLISVGREFPVGPRIQCLQAAKDSLVAARAEDVLRSLLPPNLVSRNVEVHSGAGIQPNATWSPWAGVFDHVGPENSVNVNDGYNVAYIFDWPQGKTDQDTVKLDRVYLCLLMGTSTTFIGPGHSDELSRTSACLRNIGRALLMERECLPFCSFRLNAPGPMARKYEEAIALAIRYDLDEKLSQNSILIEHFRVMVSVYCQIAQSCGRWW